MIRQSDIEQFPRTGIFVDVHDMYYASYSAHQGKIDYGQLLKMLENKADIIVANAYLLFGRGVDYGK